MKIEHNFSLKPYNSFGIEVTAKKFIAVHTVDELKKVLQKTYASELFILGGGSNMLLTKNIDKTVLYIDIEGKEVISYEKNKVIVKANAGENWHAFVLWTLSQNFGGLENLSLIPGNVGTAPIQNIGAYGVELKDSFYKCEAINIQTLESKVFSKEECSFGYRDSVFKGKIKGKFIIVSVSFQLSAHNHKLVTNYGALKESLEDKKDIDIGAISDAIIQIRQQKLPNPKEIGNSGSFFKNPIIEKKKFITLKQKFPEIPSYEISSSKIKIPAGWLIEKAGLKGYRIGDAGVHKNQALVLVNYGKATGEEILKLSEKIQYKVNEQFGILLQPEVNII